MASGLFFDPLVALCSAPLVSTTCTLLFAYEQHFFISLFNRPQTHPHSKGLLPSYFTLCFDEAIVQVFGFLGLTAATSFTNLYWDRNGSLTLDECGSFWWYAAVAGFSFGHLLYAPLIVGPVLTIKGDREIQKGRDVNGVLGDWLRVNRLRMLTVDLAAWVAAVIAVGKTLTA